jgi:DNA gyrase subunit A
MIRFNIDTVSQTGRATLGVRLMRVDDGAKVVSMAKVDPEEPDDGDDTDTPTPSAPAGDDATDAATPTEPAGDADAQVNELLRRAEADSPADASDDSDDE